MQSIISLALWVVGTFLTAVLYFETLFLSAMLPFDKEKRIAHGQCFWWSDALIGLNPYWNITVRGLENINQRKAYVIVANHQSLADIVVVYKTRMQFKWVAKDSLLKIPFIGGVLLICRHIMLERGKFGSIKTVYRKAANYLRGGMSVLFFPEGTRSETDEMNEFQNGAFKLAIKEKKAVLPIRIVGTREAIPKGSWVFRTKVSGTLTVLPAIETAGYKPGDFMLLRDKVRTELETVG